MLFLCGPGLTFSKTSSSIVRFISDKKLSPYEDFVKSKLEAFADTSTAQMFDWLKERYADLPKVSTRTVYNFVMYVRGKHNLPVVPSQRDYFPVEELPFGHQAQVDFGQYNSGLLRAVRKEFGFLPWCCPGAGTSLSFSQRRPLLL